MAKAAPSILALLQDVAGDEMWKEALPIVRASLKLTPEKLALLLVRQLAPDHVLGETEEAKARGMSPTCLREMKQRGELPAVIQGVVNNGN